MNLCIATRIEIARNREGLGLVFNRSGVEVWFGNTRLDNTSAPYMVSDTYATSTKNDWRHWSGYYAWELSQPKSFVTYQIEIDDVE